MWLDMVFTIHGSGLESFVVHVGEMNEWKNLLHKTMYVHSGWLLIYFFFIFSCTEYEGRTTRNEPTGASLWRWVKDLVCQWECKLTLFITSRAKVFLLWFFFSFLFGTLVWCEKSHLRWVTQGWNAVQTPDSTSSRISDVKQHFKRTVENPFSTACFLLCSLQFIES